MIELKRGCRLEAGDIYYTDDGRPNDVLSGSTDHRYTMRFVRLENADDVITIIKECPEWTKMHSFERRFRPMLDDNGKMLFDYLKEVT